MPYADKDRARIYFKEYCQRPEVKARKRDRLRRAWWAKHHPGRPVPPGRIALEQWREDQDERIRAEEIAATGQDRGIND